MRGAIPTAAPSRCGSSADVSWLTLQKAAGTLDGEEPSVFWYSNNPVFQPWAISLLRTAYPRNYPRRAVFIHHCEADHIYTLLRVKRPRAVMINRSTSSRVLLKAAVLPHCSALPNFPANSVHVAASISCGTRVPGMMPPSGRLRILSSGMRTAAVF